MTLLYTQSQALRRENQMKEELKNGAKQQVTNRLMIWWRCFMPNRQERNLTGLLNHNVHPQGFFSDEKKSEHLSNKALELKHTHRAAKQLNGATTGDAGSHSRLAALQQWWSTGVTQTKETMKKKKTDFSHQCYTIAERIVWHWEDELKQLFCFVYISWNDLRIIIHLVAKGVQLD